MKTKITKSSQGYRVVLVPGLSSTHKNPCLSCPDFGRKAGCQDSYEAMSDYLLSIGQGTDRIEPELGEYSFSAQVEKRVKLEFSRARIIY